MALTGERDVFIGVVLMQRERNYGLAVNRDLEIIEPNRTVSHLE